MKENDTTRSQVKRIVDGMVYHCRELAEFMTKHMSDPYFKTEEGEKVADYLVKINANHVMALVTLNFGDKKEDDKEDKEPDLIEMLNKIFN